MRNLPFDKSGKFYRGNIHTHSTLSDGRRSPQDVCQFYKDHGYDFISLTDHFLPEFDHPITNTSFYRTDDFTTILGAELHAGMTSLGEKWHILAVGLPSDFAIPRKDETGPEIAQRAMAAGAYVAVAHPAWYHLPEEDVISLGKVHAIEIINGISADHSDTIDSNHTLNVMLGRGYRYFACATDDAHFHAKHQDVLRGWVWVKSESLTPDALLESLKRGEYYSTEGPQIFDIQVKPGEGVKIVCSPADHIFVTGKGSKASYLHGNGIMEAELPFVNWNADYCRVTIRDRFGRRAWSNPIFFE